jgi:PKD repeat protein
VDDLQVTAPLVAYNDSPTVLGATTHLTAVLGSGTNVSVTWDLGDGTTGVGFTQAYQYPEAGTYTATVTVENAVSSTQASTRVLVEARVFLPAVLVNYTPPCPDAFEPDDTISDANNLTVDGQVQYHSFHTPDDEDWLVFEVDSLTDTYVIETVELENADTVIYLYDTDGVRLLDWNDDRQAGTLSSRLDFAPYQTGTYYLRVVGYDPTVSGCDVRYGVRIAKLTP